MWLFFTYVVIALTLLSAFLLYIRIEDQRTIHRQNMILSREREERLSREAMSVIEQKNRTINQELFTQQAAYEYARSQAEFGSKVLMLMEKGAWGGDVEDLKAACVRQLDGIAPPLGTPKLAIRESPKPQATWPDGSVYESRSI